MQVRIFKTAMETLLSITQSELLKYMYSYNNKLILQIFLLILQSNASFYKLNYQNTLPIALVNITLCNN